MTERFSIVGTNFCGPEAAEVLKTLQPGAKIILVREPTNKFDANAVAVYYGAAKIGYLPKAKSTMLAQLIDRQETKKIQMAMDDGTISVFDKKAVDAKFAPSPNSGYPMVEV